MKKKEMKKVLPAILAVVLVLGAGLAMAANNDNRQGVPSAKCAASVYGEDITPETNTWYTDTDLSTVIKTSNKADLIISLTAECALATDVKIKGKGSEDESTSWAQIKVKVFVDGVPAEPGEVVFAHRTMILKGLLWAPDQVVRTTLEPLPVQYIEIYEDTRTANGFNFVMKNVESGDHEITVKIMTDVEPGFDGGDAWAVIGKRTLVVESVRMVNDKE